MICGFKHNGLPRSAVYVDSRRPIVEQSNRPAFRAVLKLGARGSGLRHQQVAVQVRNPRSGLGPANGDLMLPSGQPNR